ncbi:MAG: TRAP transporter small permease [Clostridiaceae bacterium]|nr:TRAP transporter small permease [Clostridiaceae bacterium]
MINLEKRFTAFENFAAHISVVALFLIMMLTVVDFVGRNTININVPNLFELVQDYLMIPMVYLSVSYVFIKGGHVKVDLFEKFIPVRLKPLVTRILDLGVLFYWILLFIYPLIGTLQAYRLDERSVCSGAWPMWIIYAVISFGALLMIIRILQKMIAPKSMLKYLDDDELNDAQILST